MGGHRHPPDMKDVVTELVNFTLYQTHYSTLTYITHGTNLFPKLTVEHLTKSKKTWTYRGQTPSCIELTPTTNWTPILILLYTSIRVDTS